MLKKIIFIFFLTVPVTVFGIDNYTALAPIQGTTSVAINGGPGLSDYLNQIYILGVSICTGLAVLMIVIGGVEYMGSGSWGGKQDGKDRIEAAILGLIVALGSYVILNTLDTRFLNTNLNVQRAKTSGDTAVDNVTNPGTTNDAGNTPNQYTDNINSALTQTPDGGWAITPQKVAIDTDGSGVPPYYDSTRNLKGETSYRNKDGSFLNANTDNYVVVPDSPNSPALGTKVLITNNANGKTAWGIVGDHGPGYGEMSLHAGLQVGATDGKGNRSTVPDGTITYIFYK